MRQKVEAVADEQSTIERTFELVMDDERISSCDDFEHEVRELEKCMMNETSSLMGCTSSEPSNVPGMFEDSREKSFGRPHGIHHPPHLKFKLVEHPRVNKIVPSDAPSSAVRRRSTWAPVQNVNKFQGALSKAIATSSIKTFSSAKSSKEANAEVSTSRMTRARNANTRAATSSTLPLNVAFMKGWSSFSVKRSGKDTDQEEVHRLRAEMEKMSAQMETMKQQHADEIKKMREEFICAWRGAAAKTISQRRRSLMGDEALKAAISAACGTGNATEVDVACNALRSMHSNAGKASMFSRINELAPSSASEADDGISLEGESSVSTGAKAHADASQGEEQAHVHV